MDYNDAKLNGFYDELEKMGGWPAIAAIASRAIPAIMRVGGTLLKAGKGLGGKVMTGASMLPGLGGKARQQAGGAIQSFGGTRPFEGGPSLM